MIAPTAFGSPLDFLSSSLDARRQAAQRAGVEQSRDRCEAGLVSYPLPAFLYHSWSGQFVRACEQVVCHFRLHYLP
jgi:hypothetical protein